MATSQQPSDEMNRTVVGALSLGTPEQELINAVRQTAARHITSNGDAAPIRTTSARGSARPRSRSGAKTTSARQASGQKPRRGRPPKMATGEATGSEAAA